MSLYREVGRSRRDVAAALVAALAVGIGAGWAAGRATAPEPSLADAVADTRDRAGDVLAGLELVEIEYSQGTVEPAAARSAAERAQQSFSRVEAELRILDPAATERIGSLLGELEQLVGAGAPEAEVRSVVEEASQELRAIVEP
jgi:hypothetical protein